MSIPQRRLLSSVALLFAVMQLAPRAQDVTWTFLSSKKGDLPPPDVGRQSACLIADIDKDGVNDFVIAGWGETRMVWFRRTAAGWDRYVIDEKSHISAGGDVHDVDGDGDLDILQGGSWATNEVWWWENPYPNYKPRKTWKRYTLKKEGAKGHHDQIFGDFDGDGATELVFWNQRAGKLFLADVSANPKSDEPWPMTAIFSYRGQYEGLAKGDVDRDGKEDIVGGGRWFKHLGGAEYKPNTVDAKYISSRVAVGDLKKGGRPEIVMASGDTVGPLNWYEWNGRGWTKHVLVKTVDHGHTLQVADIDGDNNLDIFCAEMAHWSGGENRDAKMWIFYGDGKGTFTKTEFEEAEGTCNHESKVGDLDGDGDMDILQKPFELDIPRVDVWLNEGKGKAVAKPAVRLALDKWQRHVIDPEKPWRAVFIAAADIDGDKKQDIITGGWWYRNPGVPGGDWARQLIGAPLSNMAAVYDFDGDGDADVLGTQGRGSSASADFVWARNDGAGSFRIFDNIAKADGDFLQGIAIAHFQKDEPLAIALSWHQARKGIQMFTVPSNPARTKWKWRTVSTTSQDEQISAGDIDRDGDIDLLLGTKWLRNDDGRWSAYTLNDTRGDPDRNRLADLNADGRLDAVVGFEAISVKGKLAWYEQPRAVAETWTEHVIANVVGPMSLDVADMDGDGDPDLVAGEHNLKEPATANLYVFENLDARGGKWKQHLVSTGDEHHDGAQVVDIDGDGDLDIISIGWGHPRVLLYENGSR